jgi:hypothetical protein
MCLRGANDCFVQAAHWRVTTTPISASQPSRDTDVSTSIAAIRPVRRRNPGGQRRRSGRRTHFFLAPAGASAEPAPRIALKKSLLVSTTITSDFLLKLER